MTRYDLDPTRLAREEAFTFAGPAGRIEAQWRPAPQGGRGVAVVAHPHPAFEGTMFNKVVFHTARMLNYDLNVAALRFNFRGVGDSEGSYDEARGEVDDVVAAWREARERMPEGPLIAAGFSFGSAMTLFAALREEAPSPDVFAVLGLPMRLFDLPRPYPQEIPVAAVHGEQDQYTPPDHVREYLADWPAPAEFEVIPETDHFFADRIPDATGFLTRTLGPWLGR